MKKADYLTTQKATLAQAIEARSDAVLAAQATYESAPLDSDERAEKGGELKSAENRLKEAQKIDRYLDVERVVDLCFAHKLDFEPVMSEKGVNTREFKLRLISVFDGITLGADALRTVDSRFFTALASGRLKPVDVTLEKIKGTMNHAGTTQAGYMRDFLRFFGAIKDGQDKAFTIDMGNDLVKKVCAKFS